MRKPKPATAGDKREEWKPIPTIERYEVSSHGRMRLIGANRERKQNMQHGYFVVYVRINKRPYPLRVHRAVATAFIPNPLGLETVNHIDGNKKNNNVSNLEWATQAQNNEHAYSVGARKQCLGERHWSSKLTLAQVLEIREQVPRGASIAEYARRFGVSYNAIKKIVRCETWYRPGSLTL